jgi:hypothetical protein
MSFVFLDDPEFLNFNFSWLRDGTLAPGGGPSESDLFALVQKSRNGISYATAEYQDAMRCTLQPAAFESFQRTMGVRAVAYQDWFYSKLYQFFRILLHNALEVLGTGPFGDFGPPRTARPWEEGHIFRGSGRTIDPSDLEAAFSFEDRPWEEEFVELAATSGDDRFERIRELLLQRARQRSSRGPSGKTRRWSNIAQRDQIILDGLQSNRSRLEICQRLDQCLIVPTADMLRRGHGTWSAAWGDKDSRRRLQSLFSKVQRRKAVKR